MSAYRLATEMQKLNDLGITLSVFVDQGKRTLNEFKSAWLDKLLKDRDPCEPHEDGYLVTENDWARFSVFLQMRNRKDVAVVLSTDGQRKILSRLSSFSHDPETYITVRNVSTDTIIDGCTTKPPNNGFKVVSTAGNVLRVFEVSISTRIYKEEGCLHFLTVQEVYTGQLYYNVARQTIEVPTGEYPGYQNWPSLRELTAELTNIDLLPREVTPSPKEMAPVTAPDRGRVIFFNASTGMGMAKLSDGRTGGIHWKELAIETAFPYLESGEEIHFADSYTTNGFLRLVNVTPL